MKLSVLERLMCLDCLPDKGSYAALRQLQEAKMKLSFKEKEFKEFGIEELEPGKIKWNKEGNVPKDISLGELAVSQIRKKLEELNKEEKLTPNHLSLYEKFVEAEKETQSK